MLTKLFEKKASLYLSITGIILGGDLRLGDNSDRDTVFLRSVPGVHYILQYSFWQVIASSYEKGKNSSALNLQLYTRASSSCS